MAKQSQTFFLEEWLRSNSSSSSSINISPLPFSSSSARAIIQAWSELRNSHQNQSFHPNHLQALKTLLNSQTSLYVADPQAKLLLSILSSQEISLPVESYPLFFRLLYIWVRKSSIPSLAIVSSAVEVISRILSALIVFRKNALCFSESVLVLGALSFVPSMTELSRTICLDTLCSLLEREFQQIGEGHLPDVLAGIGYALPASNDVHFVRIWGFLLGFWGKEGGAFCCVAHGLMLLHLIEWVVSGLIHSRSMEKMNALIRVFSETRSTTYIPFSVVMAAAGVMRASNKSRSDFIPKTVSKLRDLAEESIGSIASFIISKTDGIIYSTNKDPTDRLLLQCLSLALARIGAISSLAPLIRCLAFALLTEIFPLQHCYARVHSIQNDMLAGQVKSAVKDHLDSVLFKEAGAITRAFCNQYALANEESKVMVESAIWGYCEDLYLGHRQVALALREWEDELLRDIEKIAESAFLMIVVFALGVTKHRLNSNFSKEIQMETSIRILVSFSCVEYFRRIRLPEYMDTIRGVVVSVQDNESACVSFVQSMPPYHDVMNQPEFICSKKMEYVWSKDEVQTSRILFYMRVIPTGIERLPVTTFEKLVAPTMFLYMGHPNGKVAGASHSMLVAYMSSGMEDRAPSKEKLVFYYIQRSLEGYPGITPFDGMASGVTALVRNLPAGSPAIFYCIHSLVEKANKLCSDVSTQEADFWKNWQGESEPCKNILDLLVRLVPVVDIQVLPSLMKSLAQLTVSLPKDGQTILLNELYTQVAESDDVTRKPTLVSWLQSLSYLSSNSDSAEVTSKRARSQGNSSSFWSVPQLSWNRTNARL